MACHFRQELLATHTDPPDHHRKFVLLAMSRLSRLFNLAKGVGGEESMGRRLHMEFIVNIKNGDGMNQSKTNSRYVLSFLECL